MLGSNWSNECGDIKGLIFHWTLQNHVIERSSILMIGRASWYITTLTRLVTINVVLADKYFKFVT